MQNDTKQTIKDAIGMASKKEWNEYFEFLRQQQYQRITSASPEELLKIQQQVIACNSMEFNFQELRQKISIDKTQ